MFMTMPRSLAPSCCRAGCNRLQRAYQHERIAEIMNVFRSAGEMHEFERQVRARNRLSVFPDAILMLSHHGGRALDYLTRAASLPKIGSKLTQFFRCSARKWFQLFDACFIRKAISHFDFDFKRGL